MLDFSVLAGSPTIFKYGQPNVVLTEKARKLYFGNEDPIGKTLHNIPSIGPANSFIVTGIIKEIPTNTHLTADVLIIDQYSKGDNQLSKQEQGSFLPQYLLLKHDANIADVQKNINRWYEHDFIGKKPIFSFALQPIREVYLRSDFKDVQSNRGSKSNVYILAAVSLLLLSIGCLNFINLTTALFLKKVKETGVRKVLGANKLSLVIQSLSGSLLFFLITFAASIILYFFCLPPLENFIGHPLQLTLLNSLLLSSVAFGAVLLIGIITGLYPAWLLLRPKMVTILKGEFSKNIGSNSIRRAFVVSQFAICTLILVSYIIVQHQTRLFNQVDLGFDKHNLLKISFSSWDKSGTSFKNAVKNLSGVENVSITNWVPSDNTGSMSMEVPNPNHDGSKITVYYMDGDIDLATTLKLGLVTGRLLSPQFSSDALNSDSLMEVNFSAFLENQKQQPVLVTSYTARLFGISETTLDKPIEGLVGIPVGILKDFHNQSLRSSLLPCIVKASRDPIYGFILVRVRPDSKSNVLSGISKLTKEFYPDKVFQYSWIDERLEDQYRNERKLGQLFSFFSILSVFLASLGLFGLVIFTSERRLKEIGIRKALGASVTRIILLLSGDFLKLVLIGVAIAYPIAWFIMNSWLNNYAYRINLDIWIFLVAGLIVVSIALLTVTIQARKAAVTSPVQNLKKE